MTEVEPHARLSCPHAARCAGCALSELDYGAQLATKSERVIREFARYPQLAAIPSPRIAPAPALTGYRVRAKLVVEGRAVGLFARATHEVVDIPECRLSTPRVSAAIAALRRQLPFDFTLSGVDVREVDAGTLVTLLVPERTPKPALERAATALMAADAGIIGVSESRRAERAPRLLGGAPVPLAGAVLAPHHLEPNEPYQLASAGSFVQAFPAQASRLYAAIEAALAGRLGGLEGRTLLELFAGSGALALRLARRGAHVTAVDSHAPGIEALERAAREQRLDLRALACRAEAALDAARGADAVIVDPPRRGLSPELRRALAGAGARVVAYVSCEPSTLACDLADFVELGYRTSSVQAFDLIPLSDSVETLALLEPDRPPPPRVLHADARWVLVEAAPHRDARTQLERLRASGEFRGALELVASPPSGIAVFTRDPRASVTGCRAEYLLLARGITRARGNLGAVAYERLRVVGTHSLLRLRAPLDAQSAWLERLARVGHPVLGEPRFGDPRSNRHFLERHALDRAFLHCARVDLDEVNVESALAPDLEAVLESLARPARPDA